MVTRKMRLRAIRGFFGMFAVNAPAYMAVTFPPGRRRPAPPVLPGSRGIDVPGELRRRSHCPPPPPDPPLRPAYARARAPRNTLHLDCAASGDRCLVRVKHKRRRSSLVYAGTPDMPFPCPPAAEPILAFRRNVSLKSPGEKDFGVLPDEVLLLQRTFWPVPLVNPIDHSEQCERSRPMRDVSALAHALNFQDQLLDKMDVLLLASVDALAQPGRQGMIFMENYGDLPVARSQDQLDVQANQRSQTLLGIRQGAHRRQHPRLRDFHGVIHDVEENLVLAAKMMVEPAFAELERRGNIVHGSGVVPLLAEEAGGGTQDFLAGVGNSFARHSRNMVNTSRPDCQTFPNGRDFQPPRSYRNFESGLAKNMN